MATKNNINDEVVLEEGVQAKSPKKRRKGKIIFFIIFLATLGGLIYSQYELYKLKDPTYQQKVVESEMQKIVSKVSKLILLPEETPQIVVVQDVDKLRPLQPFFKDADNGDYVLVYQNIALIYSSTKNKLINVGPVTREDTPAPKAPAKKATTTDEEDAE
jgi:hypothetical protein